jgi:hypothetical protein
MKKLATLILALTVSALAVEFNLENVQVIQGYGADIEYMEFETAGLTLNVQDSAKVQIRIDAPYQFHGIGFYVTWDDTTVNLDGSGFQRGNVFGNAGTFTANQIGKNKVYIYSDIPQGQVFDTKIDQLITRFIVTVDKVTNKARIYFIVE